MHNKKCRQTDRLGLIQSGDKAVDVIVCCFCQVTVDVLKDITFSVVIQIDETLQFFYCRVKRVDRQPHAVGQIVNEMQHRLLDDFELFRIENYVIFMRTRGGIRAVQYHRFACVGCGRGVDDEVITAERILDNVEGDLGR